MEDLDMYKTMTLIMQYTYCFNLIYEQAFKFKIKHDNFFWNTLVLNFLTCRCKATFNFVVLTQKSIELCCFWTYTIKVHIFIFHFHFIKTNNLTT